MLRFLTGREREIELRQEEALRLRALYKLEPIKQTNKHFLKLLSEPKTAG